MNLENINLNSDFSTNNENVKQYCLALHSLMTDRLSYIEKIKANYFDQSIEQLKKDNASFYHELQSNYENSFANPRYCQEKLPSEFFEIASVLYYDAITLIADIFQEKTQRVQYIIDRYNVLMENLGDLEQAVLKLKEFENNHMNIRLEDDLFDTYSKENFATQLLNDANTENCSYLYRYGYFISDIELNFAAIASKLSAKRIHELASQMVEGYLRGFKTSNKKVTDRKCARLVQIIGLERIGKEIMNIMQAKGLDINVGGLVCKNVNANASSNHGKCMNYYFDATSYETEYQMYEQSLNQYHAQLSNYSGNIIMVCFGQNRATAIDYKTSFSVDYDLKKSYEMKRKILFEQFVPKSEISYTGMAYPASEISEKNYDEIFEAVMEINMTDPEMYEQIQEKMIDALDQGEYVSVKGFRGNCTDMKIALKPIQDPATETDFVNCGADNNIPIGEVYTSPQLKGSEGLMHIQKLRISSIHYKNIKIQLKDGFVSEYSCENTGDAQADHDTMEEYIFHHRETLPIGEFALGTNTYAYQVGKQYDILFALHTLIYEKLGLHVALGDTCFAWQEDNDRISVHNGKHVIAKDNEVSQLRKEDPSKAYFGVHYDLTIPYDELKEVFVHKTNGEIIKIVEDGKFVLDGCEELNKYLD